MNKYIFEHKHTGYDGRIVENKKIFEADGISDILEEFESFLRGCGFNFKGHVEIVEEQVQEEEKTCNFCNVSCGNSWCSTKKENEDG